MKQLGRRLIDHASSPLWWVAAVLLILGSPAIVGDETLSLVVRGVAVALFLTSCVLSDLARDTEREEQRR